MTVNSGSPCLTVLIPVYNEEQNLVQTIPLLTQKLEGLLCPFEILVVDDGSRDRSVAVVQRLIDHDSRIRLVRHETNRGPGSGILTGIQKSRGTFIIFIPADLAMEIDHLSRYLDAAKNADVVVGIRSDRRDYSLFRKLVSVLNIFIIQALFKMRERQFNYISMYRREIFNHFHIRSRSVFITAEIMVQARDNGFRLTEVEIGYLPRAHGKGGGSSFTSILRTVRDMAAFWSLRHRQFILKK